MYHFLHKEKKSKLVAKTPEKGSLRSCRKASNLLVYFKDRHPFRSAHFTPQCPLHMHCIGGKKWLDELIEQVASVTLSHNFAQRCAERVGKKGETEQMKLLPNLASCSENCDAP